MAQLESPVAQVHVVTAHVSQGAAAELPPLAPVGRQQVGVVFALTSGSEPEIEMDVGRGRRR